MIYNIDKITNISPKYLTRTHITQCKCGNLNMIMHNAWEYHTKEPNPSHKAPPKSTYSLSPFDIKCQKLKVGRWRSRWARAVRNYELSCITIFWTWARLSCKTCLTLWLWNWRWSGLGRIGCLRSSVKLCSSNSSHCLYSGSRQGTGLGWLGGSNRRQNRLCGPGTCHWCNCSL
jgi:hypothetical protein